jgi:hypothetical protein
VEGDSGGLELDVEPLRSRDVRLCRNVGDEGLLLLSSDGRGEECECAIVTSRREPAIRRVESKLPHAFYPGGCQQLNSLGHVANHLFASHDFKNKSHKQK